MLMTRSRPSIISARIAVRGSLRSSSSMLILRRMHFPALQIDMRTRFIWRLYVKASLQDVSCDDGAWQESNCVVLLI